MQFIQIDDENDILFHKAYVMLCEIFPEMMPYWAFKNYSVTAGLNHENNCVAFMLYRCSDDVIDDDDDSSKKSLNIASIGVDPKYRRQGIADLYIKWIKNLFPQYSLNLHVSVRNIGAIKLYENNGFKISKTKKNYYDETNFEPYVKEGVDAYEMLCD